MQAKSTIFQTPQRSTLRVTGLCSREGLARAWPAPSTQAEVLRKVERGILGRRPPRS
jgi:hypothetical protein